MKSTLKNQGFFLCILCTTKYAMYLIIALAKYVKPSFHFESKRDSSFLQILLHIPTPSPWSGAEVSCHACATASVSELNSVLGGILGSLISDNQCEGLVCSSS